MGGGREPLGGSRRTGGLRVKEVQKGRLREGGRSIQLCRKKPWEQGCEEGAEGKGGHEAGLEDCFPWFCESTTGFHPH